ncbi:MAG: hypothetical protein GY874_04550 [Desulfobacteraceae bacterium]|nr:hypothetical protein [Desulfobacteraceae bacterium]
MIKRSLSIVMLTILLCTSLVSTSIALIPPWYDTYFALAHTIGLTPGVTIEEPVLIEDKTGENSYYALNIVVDTEQNCGKALHYALYKIMPSQIGYLEIKVVDQNDNVITESDIDFENDLGFSDTMTDYEKTQILLNIAYQDNPYYLRTQIQGNGFFPSVIVIMKPSVIQYFRDDLSAYQGKSSFVAAELFKELVNISIDGIDVNVSTEEIASPSSLP